VVRGLEVTVFCRGGDTHQKTYKGMKLVHLPAMRHKFAETLTHTALSVWHPGARQADAAIVFNAANAPFVFLLRAFGVPTAIHVDGLEWRRSKWNRIGRSYYLLCERLCTGLANALIADARGIQDYYRSKYNRDSRYIAYGAPILELVGAHRLAELGLTQDGYHLAVARLEPENHVREIVDGYSASRAILPLVVVGDAPYGRDYIARLRGRASLDDRIRMQGSIWDQGLLDAVYAGCRTYFHGHSVGGTNPSLLRAMGAAAPVSAFDVSFNREVLADGARFWVTSADITRLVEQAERDPLRARELGIAGKKRAERFYNWDEVAAEYAKLLHELGSKTC